MPYENPSQPVRNLTGSNSLALVEVNLTDIKSPDRTLRRHSDKQLAKLARSIETFGWVSPVLIDRKNQLIAGEARVEAAKRLGLTQAPAIRVEHLSEAEIRAYRIADNKLAEAAEWDEALLRLELQEIEILGFDLELTGFETPEIDILFAGGEGGADPADTVDTNALSGPPVSQLGDVWQIGPHRLICGDALLPETYQALLQGEVADMVFTDPPYNVPVKGHMGGLGTVQHREFVMASGEMTPEQFRVFLRSSMERARRATRPGGVIFACMDWRSIAPLVDMSEEAGLELLNLCVWNKTNGGMGSLYRSKHELILVARVPGASHTNNVELGRHGRNRTNVWDYPGANTSGGQMVDLKLHPTVKPIALVADAIQDVSKRGDIVLDLFGGAGTTLIAAERTGRKARLIELDPLYVDTTIRRVEAACGLTATLEETGETFEAVEARRTNAVVTREAPPVIRTRTRTAPTVCAELGRAD